MIDQTNLAIDEMEEEVRRQNERRYAFYRMLHGTDLVLWQLEERNLKGDRSVPEELRRELRQAVAELPNQCREALRDEGRVQETLDSLFEIQERLFRWRFPEWAFEDEADGMERAS